MVEAGSIVPKRVLSGLAEITDFPSQLKRETSHLAIPATCSACSNCARHGAPLNKNPYY